MTSAASSSPGMIGSCLHLGRPSPRVSTGAARTHARSSQLCRGEWLVVVAGLLADRPHTCALFGRNANTWMPISGPGSSNPVGVEVVARRRRKVKCAFPPPRPQCTRCRSGCTTPRCFPPLKSSCGLRCQPHVRRKGLACLALRRRITSPRRQPNWMRPN